MSSAADPSTLNAYLVACKVHGVKRPNPTLVRQFQDECPTLDTVTSLDLSKNYVGNRGLLAIADCIERMPNFRSLSVQEHKLYNTDLSDESVKGNPTVDRIVDVLKSHPSATALDVSANPVSNYAGRKLLGLAQLNPRICRIGVDNTRIDFELRKRIAAQCERNATALWEAAAAAAEGGEGDDPATLTTKASMFGGFAEGGWTRKADAPDLSSLGAARAKRNQAFSEGIDPEKAKNYKAPVFEKSPDEIATIVKILEQNVLFSFLGSRELRTIALAMKRRDFVKGDEILSQGGVGDALYVLQNGSADILKEGQRVYVKAPGTAVGELELMYDTACAATVRVNDDKLLTWVLDRDTYRNLVMGSAIRRREEYSKHLAKIPFLESLDAYEKMQLADALSSDEWQDGATIIEYGAEGEWMYIILEGTVEVIGRTGDGEKTRVCDFAAGDYVGELEFLNNHRTVADVVAKGFVRTAKLNRRHFEMCLGNITDLLKRNMEHPKYEYYQRVLASKADDAAAA